MTGKIFKTGLPLVFLLAVSAVSAQAGQVLFSDLGTGSDVYSTAPIGIYGYGYSICGSAGPGCSNESSMPALLFTVSGSGSLPVGQIDLAVTNANSSLNTFTVSIWTDSGGLPSVQVANAFWNASTPYAFDTCCGLVSIQNISGVFLNGGSQYFLILAPLSLTDNSFNAIAHNSLGATSSALTSFDGGSTWLAVGGPSAAFDILSTPEPSTAVLIICGVVLFVAFPPRRLRRSS